MTMVQLSIVAAIAMMVVMALSGIAVNAGG